MRDLSCRVENLSTTTTATAVSSNRGYVVHRIIAISCLGASPTPAVGARGCRPHAGVRETLYGAIFVKGVPQGSYPFSRPSVSLFECAGETGKK
jgi:hypothetical protein